MINLKIDGLSKRYPNGVEALKAVSLNIGTGMFGLLGQNGAGKSTFMRILATLQEPDRGSVHLNGLDLLKNKGEVRKRLGYLPQSFGLYPNVTAQSLLDHIARLKGFAAKGQRKDAVDALLHKVNLYKVRKQNLGGFSGGMKQRFGIAQALLGDPDLIIVDEPTAGLDPGERNRFYNLLSQIGEEKIVLLSTHIVEDVNSLCSRMAIIHQGRILFSGSPEEAIAQYRGQIWESIISSKALSGDHPSRNHISTYFKRGKQYLRVYAETQPDDGFRKHEVTLEDAYFATISRSTSSMFL